MLRGWGRVRDHLSLALEPDLTTGWPASARSRFLRPDQQNGTAVPADPLLLEDGQWLAAVAARPLKRTLL